jgi:hypothetical protein
MEPELGGYTVRTEADIRKEAATKGFNFLRKNRTTAQRAELLGLHLAGLSDARMLFNHPGKVRKYALTRDGMYLSEEEARVYKPKSNVQSLTTESMIVVEPVRLRAGNVIAVRKKSGLNISQLVVPEMLTYINSVGNTDEVLASSGTDGKLFGPTFGSEFPISAEFVESLDSVLTEYSAVLGLPQPGEL